MSDDSPAAGAEFVTLPGGMRFCFKISGPAGAPWVVTSNSHCTDLSLWSEFAASIEGRYRVLRYDQRGHGGTSISPAPYTISDLAGDVVGLLDHFGIESAHFVGISMGGATGLALALDYPSRLRSVTICNSSKGSRGGHKEWNERIALAQRDGMEALVMPTIERWFTAESVAAQTDGVRRVAEMIRTTPVAGYCDGAEALKTYDFAARVHEVGVPCLLVAGAEDGPRPKTLADLQAEIPGARLAVIPAAGHIANVENPDEFNRVVSGFIDELETAA